MKKMADETPTSTSTRNNHEKITRKISRDEIVHREKMRDRTRSSDHAGEFLEDISTCEICHENYQEPKLLPCLHTFCKKCLLNLASEIGAKSNNDKNKTIVCPECHDSAHAQPINVSDIASLPGNTLVQHLNNLMSLGDDNKSSKMKKRKGDFMCSRCEGGNLASCRCVDCKEFLCPSCVDAHQSMKALRDHKTMSIKKWQLKHQDSIVKPHIDKFCTKHKGEEMCNFCLTCHKPACKDCADLEHAGSNHNCVPLEEAVAQCRQKIDSALEGSHQSEAKFRGAWEILDKRHNKLEETLNNMKKQIKDVMAREREEIDAREKSFLTDLEMVENDKKKEIGGYFDKLEASLEDFWTAHDLADSILDIGNDYHVMSLADVLCSRLSVLTTTQPSLPPEDLAEIDVVEEDDDNESELESESVLDESATETPKWETERTIGDRGSGEGQFDWCRGVAISLDGHAVVADWGNHRVQVFNKDGSFRCVLNESKELQGRLSMPQDVACLLDGRIIAIDKSKYVRMYSPDGKYITRFVTVNDENKSRGTDVELSCVAVDRRSRIFIGDTKRNVVTVHYTDGMHIKTIQTVGPAHIAINSRDLVIVSCTQKQKVRVMNFDGKFHFQMDVYGDGEKLRPRGVGCDERDNIYVVHKERGGEKSIQVYDDKGKYLECVAMNLNDPYDVDVSPDGRVVVTDDDNVKIFHKV